MLNNNQRNPLVSIGMPIYNGERYMREAINSLLSQTVANFELIISDNCSTDSTAEICKEYASRDRRIKYTKQTTNTGASANFQCVLKLAKGQYFMWAAHDDRWNKDFLEKLIMALSADSSYGLAFSNYSVKNLDTEGEIFFKVKSSCSKSRVLNFFTRTINCCPSLIYGLFKLELIKELYFENFDFADVHFIAEISLKTKITIVDDYLYTAGTKGKREPYGLNGKKIQRIPFLRKQFELLNKNFSFPVSFSLFLLVALAMIFNKIKFRRY